MSADRETEFTHDNVDYVAVKQRGCEGCAAQGNETLCKILPNCSFSIRTPNESIIWVVK